MSEPVLRSVAGGAFLALMLVGGIASGEPDPAPEPAPGASAAPDSGPAMASAPLPTTLAPPAEPAAPSRQWALEGQLGLAMPLGAIALEGSFTPIPLVTLSAGVGKSMYGHSQVAVMPHLNLGSPDSAIRFSIGAGLSYGDYEQGDFFAGVSSREFAPDAVWGNLELSVSMRIGSVGIRGFSGYSRTLSIGEEMPSRTTSSYFELPYFGLGVSYWL